MSVQAAFVVGGAVSVIACVLCWWRGWCAGYADADDKQYRRWTITELLEIKATEARILQRRYLGEELFCTSRKPGDVVVRSRLTGDIECDKEDAT